jgi:hypothetical protein
MVKVYQSTIYSPMWVVGEKEGMTTRENFVLESDFLALKAKLDKAVGCLETNSELTYKLSENISGNAGAALLGISEGIRCVVAEIGKG